MIYFSLSLYNPWSKPYGHKDYLLSEFPLTKNKTVGIQISRMGDDIFSIGIDTRFTGQCHAGICFDISIFGYTLILEIRDNRHWHYEQNRWELYPNESNEE